MAIAAQPDPRWHSPPAVATSSGHRLRLGELLDRLLASGRCTLAMAVLLEAAAVGRKAVALLRKLDVVAPATLHAHFVRRIG